MISYLKKRFILSHEGAVTMVKNILYCALFNIVSILPLAMIFTFFAETITIFILHQQTGYDLTKYWIMALAILVGIYLSGRLQYRVYISTYTETAQKRVAISERLRTLPLSFFAKRDLADLTSTIMTDVEAMEHAYSHAVPQFFGTLVSAFLLMIGILIQSPLMALAMFWPFPIALCLIHFTHRKIIGLHRIHAKQKLLISDRIQEILENVLSLKAYGYEEATLQDFNHQMDKEERAKIQSEKFAPLTLGPVSTLLRLGSLTTIFTGLHQYLMGHLPLHVLMVFIIASVTIYLPLDAVFLFITEFMMVEIPASRMKEIIEMQTMDGEVVTVDQYDISLGHVSFGYDQREVIRNVSFTAKQGETTALVGPSGCGKTTLAKLMLRFWDVDQGEITLGGVNIRTIEPESLLSHYSVVFQDVVLFNNSILENIRIGKKNASDKEVIEAAKIAQVDEFVKDLPQGYHTLIGENGVLLSGGERQRISIARAILKDAPIIFLDESTSSVDADSETKLQEALSRLIANKTVVIIAHRLRTVENADKIIVLDEGRLVEEGTATELIAKEGLFYQLWKTQKEVSK
ncbi:MAG: ABC transporter ATP-binding protein [Tissierellia bacterium]|nr:ABC transporter ATP-binding protein [Tissierellia bacterium]